MPATEHPAAFAVPDGMIEHCNDVAAASRATLLAALAHALPDIQAAAPALDQAAAFPAADIARLAGLGALAAPVPIALGGLGLGTSPEAALDTMELLRLLGRGNLSLGRLFEAHVNAVRLVMRTGMDSVRRKVAAEAAAGHLFGLWVTDPPTASVRIDAEGRLHGTKMPCSGAGHVDRALITASMADGETCMLIARLDGRPRADRAGWAVHGMRAACNGRVCLDGLSGADIVGQPGDYLRQPEFSAGAWRGSAVALGGIEALVAELRHSLASRDRHRDPHQAARVGHALIAQETARAWVRRAALAAETQTDDPSDVVGVVNLARIAVEAAGLEVIQIAQRALDLGAFREGTLAELLFRDLATYLRQPAPDETLTDGALRFITRDLPPLA